MSSSDVGLGVEVDCGKLNQRPLSQPSRLQLYWTEWILAVRRARVCPRLVATSVSAPRAVAMHFA